MAPIDVIEVPESLIAGIAALKIEVGESLIPCSSGLQVASRYVADPQTHQIFDDLPESAFARIVNREHLVRVLAFDKWVGNCDSRQAVFTRRIGESRFRVTFVDQGDCFNGGRWTFPDLAHMGAYEHHHVYRDVTGWNSFEPVLSRIEAINSAVLRKLTAEIPGKWYQYDHEAICRLLETLDSRRKVVRDLITDFRSSNTNPLCNWTIFS